MRIAVAVAVALLLSGCGVWTSTPSVGDCAEVKDMSRNRYELSKVDCSKPEAMYRLVDTVSGRSPSCPRGDYVEDTSIRNKKTERKTRQCFVLNVKQGDCLNAVDSNTYQRTACGGSARKVSKVVDGKNDPAVCGSDEPQTYSRPTLTICITR
ncbi:hypothetical protein Lesp02_27250 [Lentzea sp. NBRC 105346]|uniref:LppU/SCO3897 family protein n=1 Tax=Lentzea sp. NBRC 105346 TaxID=3032205 RepID=UPI002552B483|nr:hypothetical protein [Lentzea sp. NBRC 105346]GLZ30536.1 hypothetical protein Lesp02_27250 [Lentzea sp. NBRC 105346]